MIDVINQFGTMFYVALAFLVLSGVVAGLFAGMFGIGGGTVVVPVLFYVFGFFTEDHALIIKSAVATSLFVMIFTQLSSVLSRYKHGHVDKHLIMQIVPAIAIGALIGALSLPYLNALIIEIIFSIFLMYTVWKYVQTNSKSGAGVEPTEVPTIKELPVVSFGTGAISSILGIGGGVVLVPYLSIKRVPMIFATGASVAGGLAVSLVGTVGVFASSVYNDVQSDLPFSFGYINFLSSIVLIPLSVFFAPIGVKISNKVNKLLLKRIFSLFLLYTALKMIYTVCKELGIVPTE